MANMSYCKFENTFKDLLDCNETLANKDLEELSESEAKYAKKLLKLCRMMSEDFLNEDEDDENK